MTELRETIFEHVSGCNTYTVTAAERKSISEIKKLQEQYPGQVEITHENKDGSLVAHVPYEWVKIQPKRRMSDSSLNNLKSPR